MSSFLFYLLVLVAVAYPATAISSDALYDGLKQRFIKKSPSDARILDKFESTVKSVYQSVIADNNGCPTLRNNQKNTPKNLHSNVVNELLKVKPALKAFKVKIDKILGSLLDDVTVNRGCFDLARSSKLSSSASKSDIVADVTQTIKNIPKNVKLSNKERVLTDVLLLGSLNDLLNSEDEHPDNIKKDYQVITSALSSAFPEEKNKIKKLSYKNLAMVPMEQNNMKLNSGFTGKTKAV